MWKYFELLLWNHFVIKGADELDLSSFKYGGMNVTGFSIMDPTYEENIQQSDCYSYEGLCPINVSISISKLKDSAIFNCSVFASIKQSLYYLIANSYTTLLPTQIGLVPCCVLEIFFKYILFTNSINILLLWIHWSS